MRIQYNQSLFTQNRYNHTNTELNKTLNKLSSGYKINQAADDAAGLGISEKMRAQIRGLNQAGENIQDGLSLINTAEGGLGQIQNPYLVRMRELIIQAANDTNTSEDRAKIQLEIDELIKGIDDIAEDTEFNTQPVLTPQSLLEGDFSNTDPVQIVLLIDDSGSMTSAKRALADGLGTFFKKMETQGNVQIAIRSMNDEKTLAFTDDMAKLEAYIKQMYTGEATDPFESLLSLIGEGKLSNQSNVQFTTTNTKVAVLLTDTFDEETYYNSNHQASHYPDSNKEYIRQRFQDKGIQTYTFGFPTSNNGFDFNQYFGPVSDQVFIARNASDISENLTPNLADAIIENSSDSNLKVYGDKIIIQAGANEDQHLVIPLFDNRANAIGLGNIVVDPYDKAMESLNRIDIANNIISERRAIYGALYNRLEHAYNNVKNTEENLTKAESTLRDADMAKEMSKLKKDQVLLQSSQSMMAQINQMSQGILEILGG